VGAGELHFGARLSLLLGLGVGGAEHPLREKKRLMSFLLQESANSLQASGAVTPRRELARSKIDLRPGYDAVIIGSGYGGGVIAARLAAFRAGGVGKSVCLLERGREWRAGEFPTSVSDLPATRRSQENPLGLFDYHVNRDIDVLVGCGLGGTSLINANVMMQPEPAVFSLPGWPRDLPDLSPYYRRAAEALHLDAHPDPPLKSVALREAAARTKGLTHAGLCQLAVTFQPSERADEGLSQARCADCGGCVTGCNYTAKNTVDMTYLAAAERSGAQIFTAMEVRSIQPLASGAYRVHGFDHELGKPFAIDAAQVIVAAGTLGSFGILRRSRDEHGLQVSAALGENFTGNGDMLGLGYNTTRRLDPDVGPTITSVAAYWESPTLEDHVIIEEGSVATAIASIVRALAPSFQSIESTLPGGGRGLFAGWLQVQADLVGLRTEGALAHSMVFLGMGFERSRGRLVLGPRGVEVDWPAVGKQEFASAIHERMAGLSSALGGSLVHNPRSSALGGGGIITVHPLGGCCLADSPAQGVTSVRGEVFGHEGRLFVADGSIIPTPLGVNPSFTIAALAEWSAEQIVRGWSAASP
jgi:cholesterol oxidase